MNLTPIEIQVLELFQKAEELGVFDNLTSAPDRALPDEKLINQAAVGAHFHGLSAELKSAFFSALVARARGKIWYRDLMTNPEKCKGQMRFEDGRCCLCVAEDAAVRHGVETVSSSTYMPSILTAQFYRWPNVTGHDMVNPMLPVVLMRGGVMAGVVFVEAASLNDGSGSAGSDVPGLLWRRDTGWAPQMGHSADFNIPELSHKQIAECVANLFIRPHKPMFTFAISTLQQGGASNLVILDQPLTIDFHGNFSPYDANPA